MILVIAEQRAGELNRATWEAVAAAQQLEGSSGIAVAVVGAGVRAVADEVSRARVTEVVVADHPALRLYTPDGYAAALERVVEELSPSLVLLPHTYQTRDLAPKLAARLDRPLVTDVVGFARTAAGARAFTRPMFQGKLIAEVAALGPPPHFVTLQVGAFRADLAARGEEAAPVRALEVAIDAAAIRETPEAPFQQARQAVDLAQAQRIVAVGRGIKGQEHLDLVRRLADAMGAELAASRPICDAGWLPMERQVGSSGQTVAPKLYLALGISGAIQHLVGMKGSQTIVAVNKDPEAPIFEVADYGIVGDLFEIVPALVDALGR